MVRIKNRYLLLNILYPSAPTSSKAQTAGSASDQTSISFQSPTPDYIDAGRLIGHIKSHISLLFGDYGLGSSLSSLKIVYLSTATSTVIIRVPRNHHQLVWAALSHITELPAARRGGSGLPCVIRVVRVSGTIRKAEEELIRRAKRDVVRAKQAQDGQRSHLLPGGVGPDQRRVVARDPVDASMPSIEDMSDGEVEGEEEDNSDSDSG